MFWGLQTLELQDPISAEGFWFLFIRGWNQRQRAGHHHQGQRRIVELCMKVMMIQTMLPTFLVANFAWNQHGPSQRRLGRWLNFSIGKMASLIRWVYLQMAPQGYLEHRSGRLSRHQLVTPQCSFLRHFPRVKPKLKATATAAQARRHEVLIPQSRRKALKTWDFWIFFWSFYSQVKQTRRAGLCGLWQFL